ncbi:MAG: flavodoxin-dependent (E)-4-hydroxy-3-methylbut-2-enyl-diphosphate synthase, partial [candidate division NC10 bacterium]|nr:flavodoxin-dependent (E)-4-hydroxy-3-methylbut-2-enyl-diphosphate synthase [candidate division NC10 bacterium]
TLQEIRALEIAGCEIVRVALLDAASVASLKALRAETRLPLVGDIHFDYRLALAALEAGVDGLRLNPGNIGAPWKVREVVKAAQERSIPIRIGVNAGSLEKDLLSRFGSPTPEAMVESATRHLRILEEANFDQIKVSLKAFSLPLTVAACRLFSDHYDYPLHLGVTEAGGIFAGTIRSTIGLGILLAEGIGDTLRISLTGDPVEEVKVGFEILRALGLRERGPILISCPSCGRAEIDVCSLTKEVEERLRDFKEPLHIAIMGCPVNGPGEARAADLGIAGGKGVGLLFCRGKILKKVPPPQLADALLEALQRLRKGVKSDALV